MPRKVLPERFQALKNRNQVHQRLERRLEELGFEPSELWDNPVEAIEQLAMMRTLELLADPTLTPRDRIRAVEMAYKVHPLGELATLRSRQRSQEEFRRRYAKREPTEETRGLELLTEKTSQPDRS